MTTNVTVAILTYRRPEGCRRAVTAVADQQVFDGVRLSILVVNNGPDHVELPQVPIPIRVVTETRPGIAAARNRAVDEARSCDVLVFLDDDEEPGSASWVQKHLDALERFSADLSTGGVESAFPPGTPRWIASQPLFRRARYPDGTRRDVAYTHNLALKSAWLTRTGLRFDERFSVTGGEDTDFSRRAVAAGARIVWADEAPVIEHVGQERLRLRWIFRRSVRLGANRIQRLRAGTPGERGWTPTLVGAGGEFVAGVLMAVLTPLTGRRAGLAAATRAARGYGALKAAVSGTYLDEYARPGSGRPNRAGREPTA
jgi:succinoglycan biosynthesis protein ExoM